MDEYEYQWLDFTQPLWSIIYEQLIIDGWEESEDGGWYLRMRRLKNGKVDT